MNIILNANTFSMSDIVIADKKRNVVIDGLFSKIIYSTENVTLSGIYINIPMIALKSVKCDNDIFLQYNLSDSTNIRIIQELSKIEYLLLDYYKKFNNIHSNISTSMTRRLQSGKFKFSSINRLDLTNLTKNMKIVIKISGIWETANEIGLAVKFVPIQNIEL